MPADFVAEAHRIVDRLRELDRRRVVFGASRHRYRFGERLGAAQLDDFPDLRSGLPSR